MLSRGTPLRDFAWHDDVDFYLLQSIILANKHILPKSVANDMPADFRNVTCIRSGRML